MTDPKIDYSPAAIREALEGTLDADLLEKAHALSNRELREAAENALGQDAVWEQYHEHVDEIVNAAWQKRQERTELVEQSSLQIRGGRTPLCHVHDENELATFLAPISTDQGETVRWVPVCTGHATGWWEGADWGPLNLLALTPTPAPTEDDD